MKKYIKFLNNIFKSLGFPYREDGEEENIIEEQRDYYINRDGDIITFEELSENTYLVKSVDINGEIVNYGWRAGGISEDDYRYCKFIDPPGGPLIEAGFMLPNKKKVILIRHEKGVGYIVETD